LDNYVKHRKSGCAPSNRPLNLPDKAEIVSVSKNCTIPPAHIENDPNLKADDFFSSLELQSSAKKTTGTSPGSSVKNPCGVVTRSRASAAIMASTSSRDTPFTVQQKSDNELLGSVSSELFSPPADTDNATSTCLMKTESRENMLQANVERSDLEDSACEEESNEEKMRMKKTMTLSYRSARRDYLRIVKRVMQNVWKQRGNSLEKIQGLLQILLETGWRQNERHWRTRKCSPDVGTGC